MKTKRSRTANTILKGEEQCWRTDTMGLQGVL